MVTTGVTVDIGSIRSRRSYTVHVMFDDITADVVGERVCLTSITKAFIHRCRHFRTPVLVKHRNYFGFLC